MLKYVHVRMCACILHMRMCVCGAHTQHGYLMFDLEVGSPGPKRPGVCVCGAHTQHGYLMFDLEGGSPGPKRPVSSTKNVEKLQCK